MPFLRRARVLHKTNLMQSEVSYVSRTHLLPRGYQIHQKSAAFETHNCYCFSPMDTARVIYLLFRYPIKQLILSGALKHLFFIVSMTLLFSSLYTFFEKNVNYWLL